MIPLIQGAALAGGEVLKKYFRTKLEFDQKTNLHDIVSKADRESQQVIVEYIRQHIKDFGTSSYGFIGEEQLHEDQSAEFIFIIDPLDGTTSYSAGIDYFCVSIAVAKSKEVIGGVIYDVMRNRMYTAQQGNGAYCNDMKLIMPSNIRLGDSVLLYTGSSQPERRSKGLEVLANTKSHIRGYRMLGATALDLSHIAAGVGNIVLSMGSKIWDIAAASLIVREAGGVVHTLDQAEIQLQFDNIAYSYTVFAGEKTLIFEAESKLLREK